MVHGTAERDFQAGVRFHIFLPVSGRGAKDARWLNGPEVPLEILLHAFSANARLGPRGNGGYVGGVKGQGGQWPEGHCLISPVELTWHCFLTACRQQGKSVLNRGMIHQHVEGDTDSG